MWAKQYSHSIGFFVQRGIRCTMEMSGGSACRTRISPQDDVFDVDRIRRLVELMEGHDLREIDLRQTEQRIRFCRGTEPIPAPVALPSAPAPATAPPVVAPAAGRRRCGRPEHCDHQEPDGRHVLLAANPNAESYVKVGDMVEPETTICIIEAMKVFNEIPAETRGKIVAVLVDDEEPVDHGRPLFKVDTSVG